MKKPWTLEELCRMRFGQWKSRGGPSKHHLNQLENWRRGKIHELLRIRRARRTRVALAAVLAMICFILSCAIAAFAR